MHAHTHACPKCTATHVSSTECLQQSAIYACLTHTPMRMAQAHSYACLKQRATHVSITQHACLKHQPMYRPLLVSCMPQVNSRNIMAEVYRNTDVISPQRTVTAVFRLAQGTSWQHQHNKADRRVPVSKARARSCQASESPSVQKGPASRQSRRLHKGPANTLQILQQVSQNWLGNDERFCHTLYYKLLQIYYKFI